MLAQKPLEGEHTASAATPSARSCADLGDAAGSVVDGVSDVAVADDFAVANDHVAARFSWSPSAPHEERMR